MKIDGNEPSPPSGLIIRRARLDEHVALDQLLVAAYAGLPGMPTAGTTGISCHAGRRADPGRRPALTVFVATGDAGELFGSIDFIADMTQYGSGSPADTIADAAGIRLLAVNDDFRGKRVGKALTRFCIERAREAGKARLVLHTTRIMQAAWAMYQGLGFVRFPEIDFRQGNLDVFGFRLDLAVTAPDALA